METSLEKQIGLEDLIKKTALNRFPSIDPNWFVKRWMDRAYTHQREIAKAVVAMMPEVVRATMSKGVE
jgi:hypothetical protein